VKKIIILSLVFILALSGFAFLSYNITSDEVKVQLPLINFSYLDTEYGKFSVLDSIEYISFGDYGDPPIFSYPSKILIQNNRKPSHISVELRNQKKITLDYPLFPIQQEDPISPSFYINKNIYSSSNPIQSEPSYPKEIQYYKGFPIQTVYINATSYIPSENTLYYYEEAIIKVHYSQEVLSENRFLRNTEEDRTIINSFVDNPDSLGTYNKIVLGGILSRYPGGICSPSERQNYVIITNQLLSSSWQELAQHRKGIVVTVENIYRNKDYWNPDPIFNDSASLVREFIKDAYLDWGTQYILLGGTWRSTDNHWYRVVPCRIFTNLDQPDSQIHNTMAADIYFSNLDGSWYDPINKIWGGGWKSTVHDKYSEVSIGRVAVYTPDQVSKVIEKIIWYDNCEDEGWLRTAAFAAPGYLTGDLTGSEYMEELRRGDGSFSQYIGFEEFLIKLNTKNRYYRENYDSNLESIDALKAALNEDTFSILNHLDHGSYPNAFSMGSGVGITNEKPFFGVSQACRSGDFYIDSDSCATSWFVLPNSGVFAAVFNTGYGYYTKMGTDGASQLLQKIYWDYMLSEQGYRIGNAMSYTKDVSSDLIGTSYARAHIWYGWNLFGDPFQSIKFTEPNDDIITSPILLIVLFSIPMVLIAGTRSDFIKKYKYIILLFIVAVVFLLMTEV
jgi:hypothetical protein